MQQLQKFLNDSTVFLTQYELRQAQASLQKLQCSLEEKRDKFIPSKIFAFRSRNIGANKIKVTQPRDEPASTNSGGSDGSLAVDSVVCANQCGFSNAHSQVLTKGADEIHQRDVLLSHLTNCKVRLLGSPRTLYIKHVRDSEILCGPVSSSVFVDQCTGCTLAFPWQQLRTHNTTDTEVYLHVTSRPIIEDCRLFNLSGLDIERNYWNQVDDFNWLTVGTPSPNWTVIPDLAKKCTCK